MKCPQCHSVNPPDSHFCRKCATPLPSESEAPFSQTKTVLMPMQELERGSIFAERYEVIEELGKGGMGRVYKVFDKKVNETIALKLIKPEIDSDEKTIERFKNELRFARKISHRHVCRMFDLGEEGTSHFITMEYVPGENLKAFIRRSGKLTVEKAVSLAKQVGEGLAEAHSLGVVHRDLKPQNIMIDGVGNAKIMDFGIARSLSAEGITATGYIIGTPDYMSPEQVEGIESDQRSDIYSLGIILYEMVTGKLPFLGDTPLSVAVKHKTEIPQDPKEIDDHIPEVLSHVILKCMEKDPEKRYQRAEDFLHELNNTEKKISRKERIVKVTKPLPPKEIKPPSPKRKSHVPLFVFIILVFISMILWKLIPEKHEISPKHEIIIKEPPSPPGVKRDVSERTEDPREEAVTRKPATSSEIKKEIQKRLGALLDLSEKEKEEFGRGAKMLSLLAPEVLKFIKDEDLQQFESTMKKIQGDLPDEGPYKVRWEQVNDKIKEGIKYQEQGKQEEAQKSYEEGQTQMRNLLALVNDKEEAEALKKASADAQSEAKETQTSGRENLLYKVAIDKTKDANDAYDKSDFSGAKTLYKVLHRIFILSISCNNDKQCIKTLQEFIKNLRKEAEDVSASELAPWFYAQAKKVEQEAIVFFKRDEFRNAAEYLIQSAFLYEKAKKKAESMKKS